MDFETQESHASSSVGDVVDEESDDELDAYEGFEDDVIEDSQPLEKRDPEWYEYTCMRAKDVWELVLKDVLQLSHELSITEPIARTLLQHTSWKQDLACRKFNEDKLQLYIDAHVYPSEPNGAIGMAIECPICWNTDNKMLGLDCGHMFCSDCWVNHISAKLDSGITLGIECMRCDVWVPLEIVQELLKTYPVKWERYCQLALIQIVECHYLLRWCPGVDCEMVFSVQAPLPKRIECTSCKTWTCFMCGEQYHSPTDCETFKNWLTKCNDDSETANYIASNTKDCPNCCTSIEKNGGCNHMHCTKCKYDFCWMCLQDWSKHNSEYYQCSRYQGNPEVANQKVTSARKALNKYLFYYERWDNHHRSLLLEEQTRLKIQQNIETNVAAGHGTWIDWQYLLDAADLLRKCRYTLKYTYPRAYWMGDDRRQLFEYQQAQLELEIENLSWKVERATITDKPELKGQMNITEIRRITLLQDFTID